MVFALDHPLPFLAESTGDNVNVRAGQSANFERLCQLSEGEEVVVLDKEYSWYKIQTALTATKQIRSKYRIAQGDHIERQYFAVIAPSSNVTRPMAELGSY